MKKKTTKRSGADEQIRVILEAKARRKRALRMKKQGKTLQEIGDAFGVSRQRAKALVDRARID